MIRVCHLFISPGHNFFGHHGGPPGEHSMVTLERVECVAGQGLRGDRFFGYQANYRGQITFFAMEVLEQMQRELQLPDARPQATRRNAFTRGADLDAWIGRTFQIQGVRFEGVCECAPCYWMNTSLGPGSEEWLRGRGGLRARILSDGVLRCDA